MAILNNVKLADRIEVPSQRTLTDSGQMHVPCAFARTGSQVYSAKSLGLADRDPKEAITVWRDEADVFDEDSVATFRSVPVTIGHPKNAEGKAIAVTVDNASELQVGMLEGAAVRVEDTLTGTLVLSNKEAIDSLEDGNQELSAGYVCDIEEIEGKYYQRNIRANHIAIVARGRAGPSCRVADEDDVAEPEVATISVTDEAHQLVVDELASVKDELEIQKQLVVDFKETAEKAEVEVEKVKVELADAITAASEGVIERCQVIEDARLISDMRDLGSKSIAEIKQMVVEDQMPEKDLTNKSDAYIAAMFELLGDASKGETPMGKLLKQQETHVTVDAAPKANPVDIARKAMIARHSK